MGGPEAILSIFRRRKAKAADRRPRILLWATIAALLFGAIEFGAPLEDPLRSGRNRLHAQEASGDIVVVGIDDRTMEKLKQWPLPRRHYARMTDALRQMGARRLFVDFDFSSASTPEDDRQFGAALARWRGHVTLATRFVIDPTSQKRTDLLPVPALRRHVELANINARYTPYVGLSAIPYAMEIAGVPYPSFAAKLGGQRGGIGETFLIDFSIKPRSVPTISAIDLLEGRVPRAQIAGKDIALASTSFQHGDVYRAPGNGLIPGIYFQVVGAETLKAGRPTHLGWLAPLLLAWLIAAFSLWLRRPRLAMGILFAATPLFLLGPVALEANLIFVDVVPSLFFLIVVTSARVWTNFRHSYRLRGTVNTISGLPNLNALRQESIDPGQALIAARIRNFAEIASALPPEEEKALVEQISNRLMLGASHSKLYQGDEGIFAWRVDPRMISSIGDHLTALHALFRSPIVVAESKVDLQITFGVENGGDRSVTNRLASALVAADEAASDGLKWKAYDSAKLKDATWKLSLLSQLDAAIDAGELWVAYQPKLDLATRRVTGAEALVRWTHPEKGPISPMEFIVAAEQHDRIERLTAYVLDQAIAAAAAINARDILFDLSVNLSARLIEDASLPGTINDLLSKRGLDAHRLTLEVTETAALSNGGSNLDTLWELLDMGVQISIDDYGTGLSTLDYLKKIPASEIKIDKSFIQAMEGSQGDRLMVHSTIQLAHSLGQKVVAEGVEDSETLEALARMGCDVAQGFLIGRPMTFRALSRQLLAEHRRSA